MNFETRLTSLIQEKSVKKAEILDLIAEKNRLKLDDLAKRGKITKEELKQMLINKPPIKEAFEKVDFLSKLVELGSSLRKFIPKVNKLFVFKLIIFVCFVFSFLMTVYYNYLGFLQVKGNAFEAMGCALALVLFGITCIETILFLWTAEKKNIVINIVLTLFLSPMAVIIFVINFQNIMVGQFEKYQDILIQNEVSNNANSMDLNTSYTKEEAEQERQLLFAEKERERLQSLQQGYEQKSKDYNLLQRKIDRLSSEISKFSLSLKVVRDQQRELLASNKLSKAKKTTYYTYLNAKIFKGKFNANFLEFFQLVLPALIFDLLSSVNLALLFFLKEEKEL